MGFSLLMSALDFLKAGRFEEAIDAYQHLVMSEPSDIAWVDGLAKSYCGVGDYHSALRFLDRVDTYQKKNNPDAPGQKLQIGVAHWCLEDRSRAIELAHELCVSILNGTVSMAPDQAGGATFGLVLHYMSVTAGDDTNRDYSLHYLRKLNAKYDKQPTLFRYPVHTVKQLLAEVSFEDVIEAATKERSLGAAYGAAKCKRTVMSALGIALFHDGVLYRIQGDESSCADRMRQVFELGYQTETIRWQLARNEVQRLNG
jgi:tetratricopeptide (TPR) repeat protein